MRRLVPLVLAPLALFGCKRDARDDPSSVTAGLPAQAVIPPPAFAPDLGRAGGAFESPLDIVLDVDGIRYSFGKHCKGHAGGADGLAGGGAILKPRRPQQLWVTGCDDATGYFHLVMEHGPTAGPANASIFLLTLPGGGRQSVGSGSTVRVLNASSDRLSGSFEAFVQLPNGGPIARGHGTFDVARRPDDTSSGP